MDDFTSVCLRVKGIVTVGKEVATPPPSRSITWSPQHVQSGGIATFRTRSIHTCPIPRDQPRDDTDWTTERADNVDHTRSASVERDRTSWMKRRTGRPTCCSAFPLNTPAGVRRLLTGR